MKDVIEQLEKTKQDVTKITNQVLTRAYKQKILFECIQCGYKIPVEGTLEEFKTKVRLHSKICVTKRLVESGMI